MGEPSLDWDDIKLTLAIAREGSLSGAARLLEIDQSTVGRRLTALESLLETTLFKRSKQGVLPTESGKILIARSGEMERQAGAIVEEVRVAEKRPGGVLRLLGNQWTLDRMVGGGLLQLLEQHPELEINLISGRPGASLWHRHPSVGLWFETPPIDRSFQVKLGLVPFAVYKAKDAHPSVWVSFHDENNPANSVAQFPALTTRGTARVRMRATDAGLLHAAVVNGIGLGLLPMCLGEQDPRLIRFSVPSDQVDRQLYIHLHPDSLNSPRVQILISWLRSSFSDLFLP